MPKLKFFVLLVLFSIFIGIAFLFKDLSRNADTNLNLILYGDRIITITLGESYTEDGYKALYGNNDITDEVKVTSDVNYEKAGTYQITYEVKYSNMICREIRYIQIKDKPYYRDSYDNIDNSLRGWWSGNKKDHSRPSGGADINELKKYNAYFMGPNEKVIYLTFDEGSNDTYVKEIVDVLNENDVKATFFFCGQYLLDNKELVNEMVSLGHSIGNHTDNHYSMPPLATKGNFDAFLSEIETVEEIFKEITGKEIDKIYRDPRGEWSFRGLQIMKDLGYSSYFYSADYFDFESDVSQEYALNELLKRYHNGAIYLIHPKNKGNYLALDSFIKEMKKMGFSFDLVKNIP